MADPEGPQIYLILPTDFDPAPFADVLARVLDGTSIACLRLALATKDEDRIARAADAVREVAHARDVAAVIADHARLAERLGLDGVHLTDGARRVRPERKSLGGDAIVGAYAGQSRHDGMTAAESGADYVSFGPVSPSTLGDGQYADDALFAWWSEMIEVPIVAEGALTLDRVNALTDITDFFAIGEEIWGEDDPLTALKALTAPLR